MTIRRFDQNCFWPAVRWYWPTPSRATFEFYFDSSGCWENLLSMVSSAMFKLNEIPNSARCKGLVLKCSSKKKEITYRHKDWSDRKVHRYVSSLEEQSNQVVQALKTEHGRARFTLTKICRQRRANLQTTPSRSADNTEQICRQHRAGLQPKTEQVCRKYQAHFQTTLRRSAEKTEEICIHHRAHQSVDRTALICIQHTEKICRQRRADMQKTASRSTDNTYHICIQHRPDTQTTLSRSEENTNQICWQHQADL